MARSPATIDIDIDIDIDADVVVIGSTGIATALYLAGEHGVRAVVLEANQAAWGCSGRSGSQGQNASGRLKRSQWIARWGLDVAKRLDTEIRTGFESFRALTSEIACDAGHLHAAHRPADALPLILIARRKALSHGCAWRFCAPFPVLGMA